MHNEHDFLKIKSLNKIYFDTNTRLKKQKVNSIYLRVQCKSFKVKGERIK